MLVERRSLMSVCSFWPVNNRKEGERVKSIGIDIEKKRCVACVIDRNGTILGETGYDNTYSAARSFAKTVAKYGKCQAACESTASLWLKTFEALEDSSISIILANPMKTRAIAEASIKTDEVDARTHANLRRVNLIAECYVAVRSVRSTRQLLRQRTSQMQERTRTIIWVNYSMYSGRQSV